MPRWWNWHTRIVEVDVSAGSSPVLGTTSKESKMAHKRKGQLTPSPQWWKHLKDWKRVFWKSERQAHKKEIKKNERD